MEKWGKGRWKNQTKKRSLVEGVVYEVVMIPTFTWRYISKRSETVTPFTGKLHTHIFNRSKP
jgi:hypothetical protein